VVSVARRLTRCTFASLGVVNVHPGAPLGTGCTLSPALPSAPGVTAKPFDLAEMAAIIGV
jgi:hypothetical protein